MSGRGRSSAREGAKVKPLVITRQRVRRSRIPWGPPTTQVGPAAEPALMGLYQWQGEFNERDVVLRGAARQVIVEGVHCRIQAAMNIGPLQFA